MYFHVLLSGGKLPTRGTPDSVGYDLYAPTDGVIDPLSRALVRLGFSASFTPGYIGKLFDRSGLAAKHGLLSMAGVIDPDYRGEWGIILYNSTHLPYSYKSWDRIGQVVFWEVALPDVCEVTSLEASLRGGGYGSTGK